MSADDLLKTVRSLLQFPEDWCKGKLQDSETGAMCIYGALFFADCGAASFECGPYSDAFYEAEQRLILARRVGYASPGMEVLAGFNNHPATTHADVLALLDEAITLVTEREMAEVV